ncbi:MAG: trypsin-like peptidase domain-containing protein [Planctomycetota bacterium]
MDAKEVVFNNLVCVARADGETEGAELELIERYREALKLDGRRAKEILRSPESRLRWPEGEGTGGESLAHLQMLVRVAAADGIVCGRERKLIERVAESLGVGELQIAEMIVASSGQAGTRRRLRTAKIVGISVAVVAVGLAFWAAGEGRKEAKRSEERMAGLLEDVKVGMGADARERAREAAQKIDEAERRWVETENAMRQRLESLQGANAEAEGSEMARIRAELEKLNERAGEDAETAAEIRRLREQLESRQREERARAETRDEIQRLREDLARLGNVNRSFQEAIRTYGQSVVILSVQYRLVRNGRENRRSSSGTGFFVTPDGYLITNKHVVENWKFSADDRRLLDEGWVLDEASYAVTAWTAGSEVLDERHYLRFDTGFGTRDGALRVYLVAPDRWEERSAQDESGRYVRGNFHALDERDLAVLKVELPAPVRALPLRTEEAGIAQLDPVMVLGFPRGFSLLEGNTANTSPSLGEVRKVEKSIFVTAPIVPGNSGGPILDSGGRVIAVASKIISGTATLGAGIPIRHAMGLLPKGEALRASAEKAFADGQWRAARDFGCLARQRDPALGPAVEVLEARLAAQRAKEMERVRILVEEGKSEDASDLRAWVERSFGPEGR